MQWSRIVFGKRDAVCHSEATSATRAWDDSLGRKWQARHAGHQQIAIGVVFRNAHQVIGSDRNSKLCFEQFTVSSTQLERDLASNVSENCGKDVFRDPLGELLGQD